MIDFRHEITELIRKKGTDMAKVARAADIAYITLHNYLKGKSDMKGENIQTVLTILQRMENV